jgi:putative hydrolase of the HAD superfamily
MGAVKNAIFDLGGVLLDWNPSRILERFYSDLPSRDALGQALFRHSDWRAFNRGSLTEPELLNNLHARTARDLFELSGLLDAVRKSLVPKDDTVVLLKGLHARGVPLYCLSDMPVPMFSYVQQRYDFWNAFRGIVVSGDVKMMKPEQEVFEHLLSRFSLHAEETVFIDDHPANIDGAKSVGLHTILFKDAVQCQRELHQLLPE